LVPQLASCEELLQEMVGFDTVNSNISGKPDAELLLAQYLESQAQNLGFETQRLPVDGESFNLLVSHQVAQEAPWLMFESHLDTVSTEGMTIDPFAGKIQDGRLYGRGACDTKGTGAAMLWALKCYASQEESATNNIAIAYTVDEEIYKTGVRTFVKDHLPTLAWKPAGVIVGEPTELKPVVAHNGVVRWSIKARGRAAHSSNPANGQSAISAMVKVISALETDYIPSLTTTHPLTGKAQCSINMIHGGVQINIVPELCEICIDRRLVPGEDPQHVLPQVEQLLDELRRADPDLDVTQDQPTMIDSPLDPSGGEHFACFVQQALQQIDLGTDLVGVGYGTDASSFGHAAIPALVLGPGNIAQGHTADEWIDIEQLRQGAAAYHQLMRTPLDI
jgi:acetylornithine deacetylase